MTDAREPESDKPTAHWPTIEADYRAGVKSVRQIAREHGLLEAAIRKRAKLEGWTRDLSAAIQAKADELVRNEAVRTEVRNANRIPQLTARTGGGHIAFRAANGMVKVESSIPCSGLARSNCGRADCCGRGDAARTTRLDRSIGRRASGRHVASAALVVEQQRKAQSLSTFMFSSRAEIRMPLICRWRRVAFRLI